MCFSAAASFTAAGFLLVWGVANILLLLCRTSRPGGSTMNLAQRASLGLVAAIPLLFGAHQVSEGFVWRDATNEHAVRCFAYTAYVFWPLYISMSFCLVEWTRRRRRGRYRRDQQQEEHQQETPDHLATAPQRPPARRSNTVLGSSRPGGAAGPNRPDHGNSDGNHRRGWSVQRRQQILAVHVVLAWALTAVVLRDMIPNDPNTVMVHRGRLHYEGWGLDEHTHTVALSFVYVYLVVGSLVMSSLRYTTVMAGLILGSLILTLVLYENQYPSTWCFFSALLSCFFTRIVWSELDWYHSTADDEDDGEGDDDEEEDDNNKNHKRGGEEEETLPPLTEQQAQQHGAAAYSPSAARGSSSAITLPNGCD